MKTDPGGLLFLFGVFAMIVMRWPYARQARRNRVVERHSDAQEKALLAGVSVGLGVLPLLHLFTPWLNFANRSLSPNLIWLGAIVLLAALGLLWRSHADLGWNWSPTLELHAEHALVRHGVYSRVRHPMYAAFWLWAVAQALLLSNWIAGPAGLVAFGAMYWLRVPREEAMMLARFGDAYRKYMATTNRLWPKPSIGRPFPGARSEGKSG